MAMDTEQANRAPLLRRQVLSRQRWDVDVSKIHASRGERSFHPQAF